MFRKTFLFAFILALLATASPLKQAGDGIHIPLSEPPTLTKPDGTFDSDQAILQGIAIQNKYGQNPMNLEHNAGRKAFNEGNLSSSDERHPSLTRRQSLRLKYMDPWGWTGKVSIGTPAKIFTVQFDTGSSDLWVVSSACTSPTCSQKTKYDASQSSSGFRQNGAFRIEYLDGGVASGPVYNETVAVAGVEVTGQHFSPVTSLSGSWKSTDGLLGLSHQAISKMNQKPFVNTAFQQGRLREHAFSMKLSMTRSSSLFLGGSDRSLYSGSFEYHKVDVNSGKWELPSAKLLLGSTKFISKLLTGPTAIIENIPTIIDSGASSIFGPPSAVEEFYTHIPGAKATEILGHYTFPCSGVPSVSFNWGGRNWKIKPKNFILGKVPGDSNECVGAIVALDTGPRKFWVLGTRFMMNMYVTFSFEKNAVGFAQLV